MKTICTIILLLSSFFCSAQIKKYVTQNGAGNKDGSSWANAWDAKIFADTLNTQLPGTEIWVAKGTYKPTKDVFGVLIPDTVIFDPFFFGDRARTFSIPSAVRIIGGFAGTENNVSERVKSQLYGQNVTILDGAYPSHNYPDMTNSYNLVTFANADKNTLLDGFYLRNYSTNTVLINSTADSYSSPSINNCYFGIGDFNAWSLIAINTPGTTVSEPAIANCYFVPYSLSYQMIKANQNCRPSISNSLFIYGSNSRGDIDFSGSGGSVTNSTFYKNIPTINSYPTITGIPTDSIFINNCIFRNDGSASQQIIFHLSANVGNNLFSVRNTFLQTQNSSYAVLPTVDQGNSAANPQFKDSLDLDGPDNIYGTADDGLQLLSSSPAKDFGLNDSLPAFAAQDIVGNIRVSGCHVDAGAYEYQIPVNNIITLPESSTESCTQYPVGDSVTTYTDPLTCLVSATVNPAGLNPVSGIIKVCVAKDATVPVINGVPYVQRHYNIEPLANAATATARLTIYFTQQEFENYNAVAGSYPKLPTSATDVTGIANIRIEQNHGTSLTSVPGTYSGATVFIDPNDNDIVWNNTSNIWEIRFDVTGFSGFFLRTTQTLPISLLHFSANEMNSKVNLTWTTSTEINSKYFDILRSVNGNEFASIGVVNASRNINGSTYQFTDISPVADINYYKLKMVDDDGTKKYSNTVSVNLNKAYQTEIKVSPNPIHDGGTITVSGKLKGKVTISIYTIGGTKLKDIFSSEVNATTFSIPLKRNGLPGGLYIVKLKIDNKIIQSKLLVE